MINTLTQLSPSWPSFQKKTNDQNVYSGGSYRPRYSLILSGGLLSLFIQALQFQGATGSIIQSGRQCPDMNVFSDENSQSDCWYPKKFKYVQTPDCLTSDCPDVDFSVLHSREIQALSDFSTGWFGSPKYVKQEWVRFRKNDPREKLFYFSAESDQNGALTPDKISRHVIPLIESFDIKYKVTNSLEDMCEQIKHAKKGVNITHIVINAHGNPDGMILSKPIGKRDEWIWRSSNFDCFSNIAPFGRVLLVSCSTGKSQYGDAKNNLAQDLATAIGRPVVGATNLLYGEMVKVLSTARPMLYHDRGLNYSWWSGRTPFVPEEVHFVEFYPRFFKL